MREIISTKGFSLRMAEAILLGSENARSLLLIRDQTPMEIEQNRLYTLEEVSQMTGYSQEDLHEEIDKGDLATTGEADADEYFVSGIELERWWLGVEKKEELYSDDEDQE